MANRNKFLFGLLLVVMAWCPAAMAHAATHHAIAAKIKAEDDITFEAKPAKKDAIYDSGEKIAYDIDLKNNTNDEQSGTIGYTIFFKEKQVGQNTVNVKLEKNGKKSLSIKMPAQKPGFYKVNFTINVTDYDDTIRRVFGVDLKKIKAETAKPGDFDAFWSNTKDTLAGIDMHAKVTLRPDMEKDGVQCYLVELRSFGNITVRGWLTLPKDRSKRQKFPVWLILPGYGEEGINPNYDSPDLAVLCLNVRGTGNSRDKLKPTKSTYLTTGLDNKYKYIYRGVIMDCVRAVDFICSRPDLDQDNIICSGASMGGYLAIAVASLDNRIKLCSANNPVFSDYRTLFTNTDWPFKDYVTKYVRERRVPVSKLLDNLDYYDLKNFAYNLKCKSIMGIGLLDNLAPPDTEYEMLNNLKNKNKLFVYPNLAHEVPHELYGYISHWMMDEFGIF